MNTQFLGSIIGAIEDDFEKYRGKEDIDSRVIFEEISDMTNNFIQFYQGNGTVTEKDSEYACEAIQFLIDEITKTQNIWAGIENTKEKYELKLSDMYQLTHIDTKTGETKIIEFDEE